MAIGNNAAVQLMQQAEASFIAGAAAIEREIERRRETPPEEGGWRAPEAVREEIESYDPATQRRQYESVRDVLLEKVAAVPVAYHTNSVQGIVDTGQMVEALRELVVFLHNPVVVESLLLPVAEPWREDIREDYAEFASIAWGFVETLTFDAGEHHAVYRKYLAPAWSVVLDADLDPEDVTEIMRRVAAQRPAADQPEEGAGSTGE